MIKPNSLFDVWTPDEVAECISSIPDSIYRKIWNEIVPLYTKSDYEWNDDFTSNSLSSFWYLFSDDEKRILNDLAEKDR